MRRHGASTAIVSARWGAIVFLPCPATAMYSSLRAFYLKAGLQRGC